MKKNNDIRLIAVLQDYAQPEVMLCYDFKRKKPCLFIVPFDNNYTVIVYPTIEEVEKYLNGLASLKGLCKNFSHSIIPNNKGDNSIDDLENIIPDELNYFDPNFSDEDVRARYFLRNIDQILSSNFSNKNIITNGPQA